MSTTCTQQYLTNLLFAASYPQMKTTIAGIEGYLLSIAREDGSGRSFNVTLATSRGPQTFHVRLSNDSTK